MIDKIDFAAKNTTLFEYEKWIKEIPYIKFKKEWEVKVIPPFMGAIVRFKIKYKGFTISVYLDCYDLLGWYGEPYWEIYPYCEDVFRCNLRDTKSLLNAIEDSFNNLLERK